jgi:perosamine synthetase
MILTAGPSITQKEIDYVTDAITNGHDENWNSYIKKFEKSFAEYLDSGHAMTTSSCTGALHLALTALGIGKGDEVIVPDMSWIATASAVCYTGATPVFADVENDSWCISPDSIKERITDRTKAIIPVHLYGQPCDMKEIMSIAQDYGLYVVEDAAPSLGAEYGGRRTGSIGDIGCFSFQGAKMLSTGEGGMLVTSNDALFDRVKHFAEHGRSSHGFDITDIGFKYKMSNLQAAWGLAQLERIGELVEKRKLIYDWYRHELRGIEGIELNKLETNVESPIYWMTSIVLTGRQRVTRDGMMDELRRIGIDTRPFFPPMSSFPMFEEGNNQNARFLGARGINLPSGHVRTHEDIKHICDAIKDILWDYE